jgi:hypothetical protein
MDDGDAGDAEEHEIELDEGGKKRKVVESLKYRLTDNGMKAGKELWENIDEKSREELAKFKSFFGSLSLRQLLIYVYEKYPKMTGESEIRRELGL